MELTKMAAWILKGKFQIDTKNKLLIKTQLIENIEFINNSKNIFYFNFIKVKI